MDDFIIMNGENDSKQLTPRFTKKTHLSWSHELAPKTNRDDTRKIRFPFLNGIASGIAVTVDGRNPAPPLIYEHLQKRGYSPYQLVQDFFHQQMFHFFWSIWLSPRRKSAAPKAWSFFKLLDLDAGDVFFLSFLLRFVPEKWSMFNVKGLAAKKLSKINISGV